MTETTASVFINLSDDVVLNIFFKLEDDPRHWACLSCVCTKFCSLIRNVCWKSKSSTSSSPLLPSDLLLSSTDSSLPSLLKLSFCCPGLLHSGVLLEHSDFGLHRELGPDSFFPLTSPFLRQPTLPPPHSSSSDPNLENPDSSWSLFDDLYYDTVYDVSESKDTAGALTEEVVVSAEESDVKEGREFPVCKRKRTSRSLRSHLASGVWNLSREQGNKLLASRFRGDCLYICDWPGCVHEEEKRKYMLFRGIFKDFKRSHVWRAIKDAKRSKIDLNCAYCGCKQTWDLHAAFCLKRGFGYHDDGEPVVRAYVCENGHVSGAWTDVPLYT